jgi:hypothetical protein
MKTFLPAAFAAVFMIAGSSMAEAGWKRSGTVVGPYGGVTSVQGSGSCANGTCSSTQTWTGPYGGTTVRKGKRVALMVFALTAARSLDQPDDLSCARVRSAANKAKEYNNSASLNFQLHVDHSGARMQKMEHDFEHDNQAHSFGECFYGNAIQYCAG